MVSSQECARLIQDGVISTGDADISGIGVIISFLISAYVSFTAVLVAYMTGLVENVLLSSVDRRVLRIQTRIGRWPRTHETLRHVVLVLSDQQIVTGIAIMAAGFVGLQAGTISVYHYQIVLYLAWLSSSVHLSALTLLRPLLNQRKGLRAWRILGMAVLFVMLIIGLVPTVSNDWGIIYSPDADSSLPAATRPSGWGIPAICFWGKTWGDGVNNDAPIGYLILVLSYVWKMGDLFDWPRRAYNRGIRRPLYRFVTKMLLAPARRYTQNQKAIWLWSFRILLIFCIPLIAFVEFLASFSASLWLSALGLVYGTLQIVIPRYENLAQTASSEESWSFGQLVPLILLVQPIGALSEHAWVRDDQESEGRTGGGNAQQRQSVESDQKRFNEQPHKANRLADDSAMLNQAVSSERLICVLGQDRALPMAQARLYELSSTLPDIVLSSRLCKLVVIVLQLVILGGACFILSLDAESIGYLRGQNWALVLSIVGIYAVLTWGLVLLFAPFSKLGRGMVKVKTGSPTCTE